jgi:hypothetical protein
MMYASDVNIEFVRELLTRRTEVLFFRSRVGAVGGHLHLELRLRGLPPAASRTHIFLVHIGKIPCRSK